MTGFPIDLNSFAKAILEKYKDEQFPKGLALLVIVKDLCELCEFNTPITKVFFHARRKVEETYPKWALIGTHAGRRTFCPRKRNFPPPGSHEMDRAFLLQGHETVYRHRGKDQGENDESVRRELEKMERQCKQKLKYRCLSMPCLDSVSIRTGFFTFFRHFRIKDTAERTCRHNCPQSGQNLRTHIQTSQYLRQASGNEQSRVPTLYAWEQENHLQLDRRRIAYLDSDKAQIRASETACF